jgi:hypothetical protein
MQNRKRMAVLGGVLLVFVGAGVAFAAYLSSATGSGQASAATAVNATIAPGSNGTSLYPGGTGTFTVTINNPNNYPVRVTSISAGSSNATATNGTCVAGSVTSDAVTTPPTTIIAAGGTGTYTLTSRMIANPDNSCQGQTFTLPLTAAQASAAT